MPSVPLSPLPAGLPVSATSKCCQDSNPSPPSSKRGQTNLSITNNILPPDAPSWIKDVTSMLQSELHPGQWQELITAWLVYKGHNNFQDQGRLPAKGCPVVIGLWIKNARNPAFAPKPLPNITLIQREYSAWWASLWLAWLQQDNAAAKDQDWGGMHVFGVNGLVSMLACLYFWGMSLMKANADMTAWEGAVHDCLFVFQQLPSPVE